MTFNKLALILFLSSGCASSPVALNPSASIEASRAPSSVKTHFEDVGFHEAEKTDYEIVSNLHLKAYSVENREDRLEFRVKLESTLAKKDERMPEQAALALVEAVRLLHEMDREMPLASDAVRLQETIEGYNSNFMSPVPQKVFIGAVPYEVVKMIHHSIMNRRASEASDLVVKDTLDPSRIDPVSSSFWKPGRHESQVNMYTGFDRAGIPALDSSCKYTGPKKSFGTHGGFKLSCASGPWKIKFGVESKSEPFNSRVVWALGYNATPIDYVPEGVRIEYDRKILTEYNSRKNLKISATSGLGFDLFSKSLQPVLNPFEDAIAGAVLQNGSLISSAQLRSKLVKSIPQKKNHDDWSKAKDARFNEAFEKQVKSLVLREGSLEGPPLKNVEELGSWSWKTLDHPDRRELRGFALFTAWVNCFDVRQNNNKVSLVMNSDGTTELSHQVSDLGSGFGEASSILHYNVGLLNKMPWDLVRYRANSGDADHDTHEDAGEDASENSKAETESAAVTDWVSPYKFQHYSVIERNPAFSRAQLDDAKWMVRKLAAFSEGQIQDALIASGFTAAEVKLVLEKLLDRRQQMVDVFGLAKEFPELMERKINRSLSFDPRKDPVPETKNAAVTSVKTTARKTKQKVVKGELVD